MISDTARQQPTGQQRKPSANGQASKVAELEGRYSALLRRVLSHQSELGLDAYALGITSCKPGEGVTTVGVNLARLATRGRHRRVLLVETQPAGCGPAAMFGSVGGPGLSEVLSGEANLADAIIATDVPGLSLLRFGEQAAQLGTHFDVNQVTRLLEDVKSDFEFIVFDLPTADELSECYAYAGCLDGVLLVVEPGSVNRREARRVQERFEDSRARLLGAVLNKWR